MGQSPGDGDPLPPHQVYDYLTLEMPDARKGMDFLNQFVTFWVHDVAAALEEPEQPMSEELTELSVDQETGQSQNQGEKAPKTIVQKRHGRRTFEEFFESIVNELDTWGFDVWEGDGWGNAVMPMDLQEEKQADNTAVSDRDGWVVQKGRGRGRGGRGGRGRRGGRSRGGRGSGPQQGRDRHQQQTKKYDHKVDAVPSKNDQEVRQNQFSQLRIDDT
ncbi:hypothetical protein Ac2012v2_000354 [Leucoagaricus gongylophorus]